MKNIQKSESEDKNKRSQKNLDNKVESLKEKNKPSSIDEYIEEFAPERQVVMKKLRAIIKEEAPDAIEKISWGMPTFHQGKNLIHFAQAKNHLGLFPGPEAVEVFSQKFEGYKTSKGTIQLPNGKELPEKLIREVVRYNLSKLNDKQKNSK